MKPLTISKVKEAFRDSQSIMVDELKDPYSLRSYIYRLERRNILYRRCESNNYAVYAVTPEQEVH